MFPEKSIEKVLLPILLFQFKTKSIPVVFVSTPLAKN